MKTQNPTLPIPYKHDFCCFYFVLQFGERTKGYIELWKSTLLVMATTSWCGIWRNLSTLLLWLAQAACFVTMIGIPFSDPSSTCCYLLTMCCWSNKMPWHISSQIKSFVFNYLPQLLLNKLLIYQSTIQLLFNG